jgi:hypothetical protein
MVFLLLCFQKKIKPFRHGTKSISKYKDRSIPFALTGTLFHMHTVRTNVSCPRCDNPSTTWSTIALLHQNRQYGKSLSEQNPHYFTRECKSKHIIKELLASEWIDMHVELHS